MITLQQMFTRVRLHLLKQGTQARNANGGCKYRMVDKKSGRKLQCAFGPLIPDSLYQTKMEKKGVGTMLARHPKLAKRLGCHADQPTSTQRISLAEDLQEIHDNHAVHEWRKQLRKVAKRHSLKVHATDKGRL